MRPRVSGPTGIEIGEPVSIAPLERMRGNVNNKKDKYNADYWSLQDRNVDVLAMSASMLMHVHGVMEAVTQIRAVCDQLYGDPNAKPIMLGGRPFGICPDLHEVLGAQAGLDDVRRVGEGTAKLVEGVGA